MKLAAPTAWNPDLAHEVPVAPIVPGTETAIHLQCLATSTAMSRYYVKHFVTPNAVIDTLNAAEVRFMLAGAHGYFGWMNQSRTTEDVDVLVSTRLVKKAVVALQSAFPRLLVRDTPVVVRFSDPRTEKVLLDVMKANQPLHRVAMRYTHRVETRRRTYLIPSREYALAMKFAAMVSPGRVAAKKYVDVADFIWIVQANPILDLPKLAKLGELVYGGGGREAIELVRRIRAGEPLQL